jgi:hypothetical protein
MPSHACGVAAGAAGGAIDRYVRRRNGLAKHPIGWRRRLRLRRGGHRGLLGSFTRSEPCELRGRQIPRPRIDRLGRRAIKGDALVVGKHGLAVDSCHFPAAKHAERVGKRPAHSRGDLVGDAQCQGANALMLDWECERPSLPKRTEFP